MIQLPRSIPFMAAALALAASPVDATLLSDGHVDGIGLGFENGAWDLHVHDEETDTEYEPDEAVLRVLEAAETAVPADPNFTFLGGAGDPVWVLPQDEPSADALGVLYLGVGSEEVPPGTFDSDLRVTLSTLAFTPEPGVASPGHFSMYTTDGFGVPTVFIDSNAGGITAEDHFEIPEDSHTHFNWAFTSPGFYEITVIASGTQGLTTKSGTATYSFRVRSEGAPFTAAHTGGNHRIGGEAIAFTRVGTPDIAGDGALAYTATLAGDGITKTNNAAVILEADGTKSAPYRRGDAVPGLAPATFHSFGSPALSASGSHRLLTFTTSLTQGVGGVTKDTSAALLAEYVDGSDTVSGHLAWRKGNPAPGLAGFSFTALQWFIACDDGTVYFAADARSGANKKRGVWARKAVAGVPQTTLLIATGESFLTDLGMKTVNAISSPAETQAARPQNRAASQSGHLALRVTFSDKSVQIVTFKP